MTFLNTHTYHAGMNSDHKSLPCMPWAQISEVVQQRTRRLQSIAVAVKTKWEVRQI